MNTDSLNPCTPDSEQHFYQDPQLRLQLALGKLLNAIEVASNEVDSWDIFEANGGNRVLARIGEAELEVRRALGPQFYTKEML